MRGNSMSKRILVTGFKGEENSSRVFLEQLSKEYIEPFLFSNDYTLIYDEIDGLFPDKKYDYVFMFGQKPVLGQLSLELKCRCKKQVMYTNFLVESLKNALDCCSIKYRFSESPGTSYCNFLYWNALKCLEARELDTKVLFIHIPYLEKFEEMEKVVSFFNTYLKQLVTRK